jgi:hypothetical protein
LGFRLVCGLLLCFVGAPGAASASPLDVKITVVSPRPARVRVEGRRADAATAWTFRNFYGSASGLAERLENFKLMDEGGSDVAARKIALGEFTAERAATRFSYDLKLDPPAFVTDAAHVSWLAADHGLLMLADTLPLPLTKATVTFILPAGWSVSTLEARGTNGGFETADAERAVFALGRALRVRRGRAGGTAFALTSAGDWSFTDEDAASSVNEILKLHEGVMGGAARREASVVLLPLPGAANLWSAETRGGTVVLLSGRLPTKLMALAQLDGALTHELFHLWVPNGLTLEGEYGWFYEGFANYQALRAGMSRGQLTFQDYLNALGRAYDGYRSARGAKELSLSEAAERRWAGATSVVYHKGLLVAFLYDLTLRRQTGGKSSLDDVFRELFRRHGVGGQSDEGGRAVVRLLGGVPGMSGFTQRHVESAAEINLAAAVEPFGLRVEPGGVRTHVGIVEPLEREQRELLRKLGYNDKLDAEARRLREQMKKRLP